MLNASYIQHRQFGSYIVALECMGGGMRWVAWALEVKVERLKGRRD